MGILPRRSQTENFAICYLLSAILSRIALNLLQNAFLPKNRLRSGKIFFDAALLANPVEIPNDPLFQSHRGQVARLANQGGIRYQMPHFTWPKFPIHNRLKRYLQCIGNQFSDPFNGYRLPTSDIHRPAIQFVSSRSQKIGASNIFYKTEISRLLSIFVDNRPQMESKREISVL